MTIPPDAVDPHVFMVEAYRSTALADDREPDPDLEGRGGATDGDRTVIGVIDIPADEVALFLIFASDASAAREIVRARGLQPIRVVPASWSVSGDRTNPNRGGGSDET
jgi:hypothetical protein